MLLQNATWPEVEAYLETHKGIIVPIGSTEQHGPSGLIGTDTLTAEFISRKVGERASAFVAPALAYGMAQHHMAFKGTITLQSSTLGAVIRDIVMSLVEHGFERIFFINGHGGNVKSVKHAFSIIQRELAGTQSDKTKKSNHPSSDVGLTLHNWWMGTKTTVLRNSLYGEKEGYHATPSEIAVTWHALPSQQRNVLFEPISRVVASYQGPKEFRALFPDGRIGSDPSLAKPEDGARLVEVAVEELTELYRQFLLETPSSQDV